MSLAVELLPSHVQDPKLQPCTTFRVEGWLALDAGSLGHALTPAQQLEIEAVLLTHAHLDHVGSLPILVAESFAARQRPLDVYATKTVTQALEEHLFNDLLWPGFQKLRLKDGVTPPLRFHAVAERDAFKVGSLSVLPVPVTHTVPSVGWFLDDGESSVGFTGDTASTDEFWTVARERANLRAVYADVSFSSDQDELARRTQHFTPRTLLEDLAKLDRPDVAILAMHLKPTWHEKIVREIENLHHPQLRLAKLGQVYRW